MLSIEQTVYTPGEEVIRSEWFTLPDGSCRMVFTCLHCALTHTLTKSDTFHGNTSEVNKSEKLALQSMIDRGCCHIQRGGSMKGMDPNAFSGMKGKSKGGGSKGGASKK